MIPLPDSVGKLGYLVGFFLLDPFLSRALGIAYRGTTSILGLLG
jgi:hypothetical protein